MSLAPSQWLEETEALRVVLDELKKQGLPLRLAAPASAGLTFPFRRIRCNGSHRCRTFDIRPRTLRVDLYDKTRRIAVELVTRRDEDKLGPLRFGLLGAFSHHDSFDAKKRANWLAKNVRFRSPGRILAIFYDPAETVTVGCENAEPEDPNHEPTTVCRGDSRVLLRKQVRDFVRWLRRRRRDY